MKVLISLGFLIILIQNTVFAKYINFGCIAWDPLSIYIILLALYRENIKDIYKAAFLLGFLQDIIGVTYFLNIISKVFLVLIISFLKEKFFLSSIFSKISIIFFLSVLDVLFKQVYQLILTKEIKFCYGIFVYISLNFMIFYLFYLLSEIKLKGNDDKQI